MRKILVAALVWLLFASLASVAADGSKTVLIIISRDGGRSPELMLTKEVGVMVSMLKKADYAVVVSSPTGAPIVGTKTTLVPDMKNADIRPADYVGYMVPCMALPMPAVNLAPELMDKIKQIGATKKPLAAQMSSIDILKRAGLLEGKKYAVNYHSGVVRDGNVITNANCPYVAENEIVDDLTGELTRQFIDMLAASVSRKP